MKTPKLYTPIGFLCGIFLLSPLLLVNSCKSPADAVYKTSAGTHIAATTALKAWNNYLPNHTQVTVADELKVQKAYDQYKVAQLALLSAAIEVQSNPASSNKLENAIVDTSAALASLLNLIRAYGVKF